MARLCALAVGSLTTAPLPIAEPVSAVAANEEGAIALTRNEVRIMDEGGLPIARLPRQAARALAPPPRRRREAAGGFASGAGILDDDDFNDPHDPDSEIEDAENLLVGDDPPAHHPTLRSPPASLGVALALGGRVAWAGRQDGLWRIPLAGGAERMALPASGPVRAVAVSADGRSVLAASDGGLAWSEDGGDVFLPVADAPRGVTRLAVTDARDGYVVAADGLHRIQSGSAAADVVVAGAQDVVSCGPATLVLAHQRIAILGGSRSRGDAPREGVLAPPGTERLACAPDGAVWVAYGAALWISDDEGVSWTRREDVPVALSIGAVAVTRLALWVASGAGLAVLPLGRDVAKGAPSPLAATTERTTIDQPHPRWRWWLSALPRVDVGFATARSNARREVRAFLLLSFFFDPRRATRVDRWRDEDVHAADRQGPIPSSLPASPRGEGVDDPIAAEERDAALRLLDD